MTGIAGMPQALKSVGSGITERQRVIVASAIVVVTFFVDAHIPLGFAGAVPYSLAVLVVATGVRKYNTAAIALAGISLTFVGYWLSPAGGMPGIVWANRMLALISITAAMWFGINYQRTTRKLRDAVHLERQRFFERSMDLLVIAELNGTLRRVNNSFASAFGYSRDEVLTIPFWRHIHRDDRLTMSKAWLRLKRGESLTSVRHRYLNKEGQVRWVEWNVPAVEPSGDLICAIGRDVTEQIAHEHRVRQAQLFLRGTIDSFASHICILDQTGQIVMVNKAWRKFAEANGAAGADGFVGSNYLRICRHAAQKGDDSARQFLVGIQNLFSGWKTVATLEYACHSPDEDRWYRCDMTSFIHEGEMWVTISHDDITQHRRAEERLLHSQRLETVGSLAGGLAHEFNNLLQIIDGYTHLAIQGISAEHQVFEELKQVLCATDRAASLTKQLLSFGRRQLMQFAVVDLNDLTTELGAMLKPLLGERIRLTIVLYPTPLFVRCDPHLLQQALMNLCVNARDAMPLGGELKIEVKWTTATKDQSSTSPASRSNDFALITVSDTGVGMTPDIKQRMFDPFFTTKDVGQGTGLGLSMVFGVITQSSGNIDVVTEPNQGTEFHVRLPLARPSALPARRTCLIGKRPRNPLILVAEDEPSVRDVINRLLVHTGFRVELASSGNEAIRKYEAKSGEFDIVLLDVVMRDLTGIDVANHIRRDNENIPIIFCTGYTRNTPEVANLLSQGTPVLWKPVRPSDVLKTLNQALFADSA